MLPIQSLIPEDFSQLVHTVEAAHHQLLQIQLGADSQSEILILAVAVCMERSGHCTSGLAAQNRRLHLHEALVLHEGANEADDLRSSEWATGTLLRV